MTTTSDLSLTDYQLRLIQNVKRLIEANYFTRRPKLRILDTGCDVTGRQLNEIALLTDGEIIGINIADGFPSATAVANCRPNVQLRHMDGMDLAFDAESFDFVISANILEHVADPQQYIRECSRVMTTDGIAYFECSPVWTGPRGHHIHEDMVRESCPNETSYRNDGTVIPDWSHLTMSEAQMLEVLETKLRPETCRFIASYLYHSTDLNHCGWRQIERAINDGFPVNQITTWGAGGADPTLRPNRNGEDFDVDGFRVVGRKKPPNPISRRLIWRLRRAGF